MLPKDIVKRGTSLAVGTTVYGCGLTELPKEELLAIAAIGWDMYSKKLKESIMEE